MRGISAHDSSHCVGWGGDVPRGQVHCSRRYSSEAVKFNLNSNLDPWLVTCATDRPAEPSLRYTSA
jgi:hypothetical protein